MEKGKEKGVPGKLRGKAVHGGRNQRTDNVWTRNHLDRQSQKTRQGILVRIHRKGTQTMDIPGRNARKQASKG
eukprot:5910819-Karenia_brevis.AAC.1